MKEDFLHFIWRFQKFDLTQLQSTSGLPIHVESPGTLNHHSGPDFLNARVRIGDLLWNGPVEIHLKSSSWYHHRHHQDPAYDQVILHVVWEVDIEISRSSGKLLPTLCLADYVASEQVARYQKQFLSPTEFIPCEKDINHFPDAAWPTWKERLFVERMEEKVSVVNAHLAATQNDWEAVFFRMLFQGFGLNVNGKAFLEVAQSFPFKIVRKLRSDVVQLEALFMGQARLLSEESELNYYQDLKSRYAFIKKKYRLRPVPKRSVVFARLRPANFPTVRLAQLAQLFSDQGILFQRVIDAATPEKASLYFTSATSDYWKTHYNFGVASRSLPKKISPRFFDLLLINTLLPIRFAYAQFKDLDAVSPLFEWGSQIPSEHNVITASFTRLGVPVNSGMDSQSLLHLKKKYCDLKKCLSCALGFYFLKD